MINISILTHRQIALLARIGRNDFIVSNFYLTGGTALASFYLKHRYSEDLDFFSELEFDLLPLDVFFKEITKEFNIKKIDFQQSYNRNLFFLHFDEEIIKLEFTFFPFPRIEPSELEKGVQIDSLLDIAVNKLFTIYQRTKARDFIDLYCICQAKNFSITSLISKAKIKFDWHIDPLQLGTQFMQAGKVQDVPRMIKLLEPEEVQDFFTQEAQKLGLEIIE